MHHHQNGRLVVSGEERVVDNCWLIIFPPFLPPTVCFLVVPNCTCHACAIHIPHIPPPKSPCSLVFDLAKSMPPEFSCLYPPFYRRLYSSTLVLVSPFLSSLSSRPVDIAYSPLSRVGHLRVTSALLFSFYLSHLYCIITGLHPTIYI